MRRLTDARVLSPLLAVLIAVSIAPAAHGQAARSNLSDAQYIAELTKSLDTLRAELQGKPRHPLIFSVNLFFAQGEAIRFFPVETLLKCVDAFHEAGARRVDINPAVNPWRNGDAETIEKYDAVAAHIRKLGMQLALNPQVNHHRGDSETFATWSAAALKTYPEMARRYKPDVFAVVHEPTTMTSRILPGVIPRDGRGYVQAVSQAVPPPAWAGFVREAAAAIKAASPTTRCGAGVLPHERAFLTAFLAIKDLDAISLDIYNLDHIPAFDSMIEAARKEGKTVYIEESWRETFTDPMFAKFKNVTPRPGGSAVYADLDSHWLETMALYASVRGLESMTVCGVTSMQSLFYYASDGHGGNLDPAYVHRAAEAVNRGERTATFQTLKRLTAQYEK